MANYKVNFSARLVDGNSTEATCLAYVDLADTTTIATLVTDLNTWLAAVDGVTDGVIQETRLLITPGLPSGLKTATSVTTVFTLSRVEQIGLFTFTNVNKVANWGFAVPSFSNALIVNGSVDNANAAVTTLVQLMYTTPYCTNGAVLLNGFEYSSQANRKKRKQLARKSRNATPV